MKALVYKDRDGAWSSSRGTETGDPHADHPAVGVGA
jgi:hypothetical protein